MKQPLARSAACTALAGLLLTGLASAAAAALGDNPGQDKPTPIGSIQHQVDNPGPSAEVMIAAQRADWRDAPENSLSSIEDAIQNGAEIIELDVQLTSDGVPVLMHDTTVDRTTRESGSVDSFTAEQITQFRLLDHMGRDDNAVLSEETVPTLEAAMELIRGRAMININKGWDARHEIAKVLQRTGTEDHTLMKGAPSVEAAVEYMDACPEIRYAHILDDDNHADAVAFPEDAQPVVWEVAFNTPDDVQAQEDYLDVMAATGHAWINTMWDSLAAGNTDEASLREAEGLGWQNLVDNYNATILQIDNVGAMDYWRDGGPLHLWERQPGANSIRIQPETDIVETESRDVDENRCAATTPHLAFVDVCDGITFNHTRKHWLLPTRSPVK